LQRLEPYTDVLSKRNPRKDYFKETIGEKDPTRSLRGAFNWGIVDEGWRKRIEDLALPTEGFSFP